MFRCLPPWPVGSCDLPPRVWLRPFQPSSLPTQHLQEYDPQSQKCSAGAWPGRAAGHLCCLFCCLWCVCVCVIVPCSLPPLTQPSLWSWSQGTPAPSSSSSSPTACVKAGPLGKSIMGEPPALPGSLVGCAVGDSFAVPPHSHTHTPLQAGSCSGILPSCCHLWPFPAAVSPWGPPDSMPCPREGGVGRILAS